VKEQVINLLRDHAQIAFFISLSLSILIAVAGLIPSFFMTAANIIFFGFWQGVFISFLGEALGAIIAFILYRKGFKKIATTRLQKFPKTQRLLDAQGTEAFLLILYLRLIPFVPSGLVTFAGAVGRVSLATFALASSLGKIPALLLEGYSAYEVTEFKWQGKIILTVGALVLIFLSLRKFGQRSKNDHSSVS
jgi:uncharacterized membrane protein YdjX (TVP38/TMEM64 family)